MSVYEARLQVVHDCPYSRLTRQFPEATIAMWCNLSSHVLEISCPEKDILELVTKALAKMGRKQSTVKEGGMVRIVAKDCDCKPGIANMVEEEGLWYEEPVIYKGGWEHYRVIAHHREKISDLVARIEKEGGMVKLASLKPLKMRGIAQEMLLTSSSVLSGMTNKQIKTLAEAWNSGYFEEPAKIDLDRLARRSGLSRSTYAEHLRKAQAHLIANLCPLLQLAANEAMLAAET